MDADFNQALKGLSDIGFRYVEAASMHKLTPTEFAKSVKEHGLEITSAHIGLDLIRNNFDEAVETAQALGITRVVVPWLSIDAFPEGWVDVADQLMEAGEKLAAKNLKLSYHNHDFEFKLRDGLVGFEVLWDHIDLDIVEAELDLCWVQAGGHSPSAWIDRLAGHVPLVHFKDWSAANGISNMGEGDIDWAPVIKSAASAGVEFGIVEHDHPKHGLESMKIGFDFLINAGLTAS